MDHISAKTHSTVIAPEGSHSTKGELVVKGVATAVAASAIIQTGKGVVITLSRHPLVMFGMGMVSGYLAHKYRKEIIPVTSRTVEQSKEFVLRQKENLNELLAESQENTEETDATQ